MSFDARRLRHRISIEEQVDETNSSGETEKVWEFVAMVWAAIEPFSPREMRELFLAQQIQSGITTKIIIRYRPGIVASMRAIHSGIVYNIEGVIPDPDSGIEWMTLQCSSGLNEG